MLLLGAGAGLAFNPVLLAAMGDVEPRESGLASGVVNTSFMMGGALGLAILVALSESRTAGLLAARADPVAALNAGPPGVVPGRGALRAGGRGRGRCAAATPAGSGARGGARAGGGDPRPRAPAPTRSDPRARRG